MFKTGECCCRTFADNRWGSIPWWNNSWTWGESLCWSRNIVKSSEDCMTLFYVFNGEL